MRITVIVAEKAKAAEAIAKALAGNAKVEKVGRVKIWTWRRGNELFRCLGVRGHIFTSDFIREIRESLWQKVDPKKLLTDAPLEKVLCPGMKDVLKVLRKELKKAHRLIIATDYDREGENIGWQVAHLIARKVNPSIEIKRARFSALTPDELREAFREENLTSLDMNKVMASETRQELDLRFGVALTRAATVALWKYLRNWKVLSLGPCQTPTLGLIVERYLQHLESVERARREVKWRVEIRVKVPGEKGYITLRSEKVFTSRREAEEFLRNVPSKVLISVREPKEEIVRRPIPLNTTRLAALAAKHLKLSSKEALGIAERLYLSGLISYPRTETERFDPRTERALRHVLSRFKELGVLPTNATLTRPSAGKRDDKAHPPIHPVRAVPFDFVRRKLGVRPAALYELIVRHTLACFLRDARVLSYTIESQIAGVRFRGCVRRIKDHGFLLVYKYHPDSQLPSGTFKTGTIEVVIASKQIVEERPPVIPPISEGELVRLMDRLHIGTDATFADHIHTNIERGYVKRQGGRLVPTEYGLKLALLLKKYVPELIDPHLRARIERFFDEVERGIKRKEQAVREALQMFLGVFEKFTRALPTIARQLAEVLRHSRRR